MADLFVGGEGGAGKQPSNATKARLAHLIEQNVTETGKLFRSLCQRSGSREVLLKAAKKMAAQEGTMENTLNNLRYIEKLVERSLDQAHEVGRSIEQTSVVQRQLQKLNGNE